MNESTYDRSAIKRTLKTTTNLVQKDQRVSYEDDLRCTRPANGSTNRPCYKVTGGRAHVLNCSSDTITNGGKMGSRALTRSSRRYLVFVSVVVVIMMLLYKFDLPCSGFGHNKSYMVPVQKYVTGSDNKLYSYDKNMPIVFIGGMPRSGTTLIRVLLDAHPHIRCGEETRVIPRVLNLKHMWAKSEVEATRLAEAGITTEVLDSALAAFILEIIARHGEPAPRLCNKDPFTLRSAVYLNGLFPNSKFVLMVRDGRAVVHSIISRKVTITGFNLSDYRQCLTKWNSAMQNMHTQCTKLGPELCIHVYYEQLVLHPRLWLEKILTFLDVPWNESVLQHDKFINKPGGISLSKLEKSSDQVIKPINLDALTTWVGQIPDDIVSDMNNIAPMLSVLGYDPKANPPDYGKPDTFVIKNTNDINKDKTSWEKKVSEYRINAKELAKIKKRNREKNNMQKAVQNILNNQTMLSGNSEKNQ